MSASPSAAPIAFRVGDRVRLDTPWEVYGERVRRYELHYNGQVLEVSRGPLLVEGFGLRVFQRRGDRTGTGFQATTDGSDAGIARAAEEAQQISTRSDFPAKRLDLPAQASAAPCEVRDEALWHAPIPRLTEYMQALFAPFDRIRDAVPSFSSIRATLAETSIANSAGLRVQYPHTTIALEVAVKAFGGPEGRPPGEYWVNSFVRRIDPAHAGDEVPDWCRFAQDARRAQAPPTGELPVVVPPSALAGILPDVFGFRWTGGARLRELAPTKGAVLAAPTVTVHDDGRFPWGPSTGPYDDEGTPSRRRTLIAAGAVDDLLYDVLHAGAFDERSTGNGFRGTGFGARDWLLFSHTPNATTSTLVLEPGSGGSDLELAEAAGEGIWLQQLGWAIPDAISGNFGGEIRIGYRIRHGKIAEPIRGGTVGGLVVAPPGARSMLTSIAAVGSKAVLADEIYTPAVLVNPLTVAGETAPGATSSGLA